MNPTVIEPRPGLDVGRVLVDVHVENADDLSLAACGLLAAGQVRSLDTKALAETGTNFFCLPTREITGLGLRPMRQRSTRTATGPALQQIYSAVRITVENRDCLIEVMEVPDGSPALLGQVPLELMDFWIDMTNKRLAGNPEHGGAWMIYQF